MVQINIGNGQGITQAIRDKIGAQNIKNKDLATWQKVMAEVNNAQTIAKQNDKSIFTGGNNAENIGNKSSWKTDFVVKQGTVEIDDGIWAKIQALLTGKAEETKPEEPVVEPETTPETEPQETPEETPVDLQDLPNGVKMQMRDIVNIGKEGSKETVAISKNDKGVKCYYQVETDPKTGEAKMGRRLAADTRGLRQDQYYAIDDTIADGAEVDTNRTVDGKKNSMSYTIKEDGKNVRYAMIQNEDGTYGQGDKLISVAGSNRFLSQTNLDEKVKNMLGGADLPKGVEVQVLDSNGGEMFIFKKDGQRLSGLELKELVGTEKNDDELLGKLIKEKFGISSVPDGYDIKIARGSDGSIIGLIIDDGKEQISYNTFRERLSLW